MQVTRRVRPEMDIGDILTVRGERFWVRGFDPIGARPRLVYLRGSTRGGRVLLSSMNRGLR